MEKLEGSPAITPELMAELQEAIDRAMKGIRDPEAMHEACERMDRMREETFRKHGLLDIGVPAIRALRDGDEG
jgi:hypothetical protein